MKAKGPTDCDSNKTCSRDHFFNAGYDPEQFLALASVIRNIFFKYWTFFSRKKNLL